MASTGKKIAAESVRAAACAGAGACALAAAQQAKCGNIPATTAFVCGFLACYCVEKTAALASNS